MRDSIDVFDFIERRDPRDDSKESLARRFLEQLLLNDLKPDMAATSRSGLQLVAALADAELFKATAKAIVECQDHGGILPSQAPGVLASDCPSVIAKHGDWAVEQMAKLIMSSEIHSLSRSFRSLFDD